MRHVTIVFAGLIGVAHEHLIDRLADRLVARHQLADRERRQIIGAYPRQTAFKTPDGRAQKIADEGVGH
jgi:hypothetical protein